MPDHIEVREKMDGTWEVWYPEEGYIPCAVPCSAKENDKKHTCKEQGWTQSSYGIRGIGLSEPDHSQEGAMAYATMLADGREIKVIQVKRKVSSEGKEDSKQSKSAKGN